MGSKTIVKYLVPFLPELEYSGPFVNNSNTRDYARCAIKYNYNHVNNLPILYQYKWSGTYFLSCDILVIELGTWG